MLRDERVAVDVAWAAMDASAAARAATHASAAARAATHASAAARGDGGGQDRGGLRAAADAREIDRQLRRIAKRKAGLEIEEARWLREAETRRIWRNLGFSTALEYLEDVFGYAPRTAVDRLRVAKELGELPALETAVREGELPYSAARELTRVMTRETEAAWLASARGKNLRDIEELVAGRKKGDAPDAPMKPELVMRKRTLELSPRVNAMFEQCRAVLADELGSHVEDAVLVEALCRGFLGGEGEARDSAKAEGQVADEREGGVPRAKAPRPAHRIVIYKCDDCSRAWQQGRGRRVELTACELALIECDAETVHTNDDDRHRERDTRNKRGRERLPNESGRERMPNESGRGRTPNESGRGRTPNESGRERATSNIPQWIRNRVWARDRGRCRVPGCRATRNLDVHHILHRSHGGDHDLANLILLCSGHHKLHHEGLLAITGRAPDLLTFVRDGKVLVDAGSPREARASHALRKHAASSKLAEVTKREQAKRALVELGFKTRAASAALDEVSAHVGSEADVGTLVKAALACGIGASAIGDDAPAELARQALVQLGFSAAVAEHAVEQATAHVGADADVAAWIKEALRWCR